MIITYLEQGRIKTYNNVKQIRMSASDPIAVVIMNNNKQKKVLRTNFIEINPNSGER